MKKISYLIIFAITFLSASIVSAQSPDDVLLTIDKRSITAGEFERIYKKNYGINAAEKQSVTDYFDLFLKFKLKVSAALDAGLDTLPSFKKELSGYRNQLVKNYLTDTRAVDSLAREAYERSKEEVNVSHILIIFPDNYGPADTLAAYKKIADIRKRVMAGESFEKLAEQYSADLSAKKNKGNLGYFSAFRFPYTFESCAYRTKVGQVSNILRTNYGCHIIRVNDRRPSLGQIRVAHIMVGVPQNAPDSAWLKAKSQANFYYQRLVDGEDFATLAKQVSADKASAEKGGELPWFTTGRMVPEFETAAFALKKPGEMSQPVKTAFGWHIIKLLDRKGLPPFDEVKADYTGKVTGDERAEIIYNSFIQKLKKEIPNKIYPAHFPIFYAMDSTIYTGPIKLPLGSKDLMLGSLPKEALTVADFKNYLQTNPAGTRRPPVKEYVDQSFAKFFNNALVKFQDKNLETLYPDFGALINEYHDGILLFDIMDREVWTKASRDSVGLAAFYDAKKDKPMWGERLNTITFTCKTPKIAEKVKKIMSSSKGKNMTDSQILKTVCDTAKAGNCLTIERRLISHGESKTMDSITWKAGIYEIKTPGKEAELVVVLGTRPAEAKSLSDVRGLVVADYQNYLEEKWLSDLKNKYKIVVNQELLHKIADKYKNL